MCHGIHLPLATCLGVLAPARDLRVERGWYILIIDEGWIQSWIHHEKIQQDCHIAVALRNKFEQWGTEWAWIDFDLLPGPPQSRGSHLHRQQTARLSLGLTRLCNTVCHYARCNLSCLGCFGIFWRDNIRSVRKKLLEFAKCLILLLLHLLDGNATMRWRCKNYKLAWASICAKTKAPPLCFYLSTLFSTELRVGAFTLQIQLQVASVEALALPRCSCRKQHVSHRFCFNIMSLSKFDLYQPLLASVSLGNFTSNILSTSLDTVSPSWASCDLEQPTDSLAESDSEVAQAWTKPNEGDWSRLMETDARRCISASQNVYINCVHIDWMGIRRYKVSMSIQYVNTC